VPVHASALNDGEESKVAGQLRHGIWILLGQLVLLIIAVVVALLLAEVWLFGAITLLEAFPQRPVLASGILLSLFAILFLCIRGAKMDSRPIAYFASRAVLLIGSAIAGIASLETIVYGSAALGTHSLREACLYLAGGLLLVAVAAAGVRYSFNWRLAYWIIFSAALAAVVFSVFGVGMTTFEPRLSQDLSSHIPTRRYLA
jgi:hypothetical protein